LTIPLGGVITGDLMQAGFGGRQWVDTLGGPHILVPQSALPYWDGAPTDSSEDEGDYGRACSVRSYMGLIDVGPAQALVLGDTPALTTFLTERKALVRWVGADSEEGIVHAAMEVMDAEPAPEDEALTWTIEEPLILFDSVLGHEEVPSWEHLRVDLTPGRYTVRAAYVEHPRAHLILVRFGPSA
jgi:hypothetical protein